MTSQTSNRNSHGRHPLALRMSQPCAMKTKAYVYGIEKLNGYDAWALFKASAAGDLPKVKELLAKDPRLVNAQYSYRFPIHLAVGEGHAGVVKLLLDQGADPGQSRYTYDSWDKLLLTAAERGHRQVESILQQAMQKRFLYSPDFHVLKDSIIARDADEIAAVLRRRPELARASDEFGNNALHWSVITRQLDLIGRFVEVGTPIDAKRADGQTPVLLAVNGATDYWFRATRGKSHSSLRNASVLVGNLLARGADYNLSVAAAVGDQERVEQLLKKDSGLAQRLDSARISPLSYAAREGHLHLVRLLLEQDADPNLPQESAPAGLALYWACCGNHLQVAQLLLELGADPNAGMDSCECCLTICRAYYGDRAKPLQQLLRSYGAYTPPYDMTLAAMKQAVREGQAVVRDGDFLETVLRMGNLELLDLYLESCTSASQRRAFGSEVTCPKSPVLVRRLLAGGLDPNRPDWLGRTLLHTCAENGDRANAATLLDAGADINARAFDFHDTPLAAAIRCEPEQDDQDPEALAHRKRRMVEFLLKRGAVTNLPGDESWATPLAWARKLRLKEIEAVLIERGATY